MFLNIIKYISTPICLVRNIKGICPHFMYAHTFLIYLRLSCDKLTLFCQKSLIAITWCSFKNRLNRISKPIYQFGSTLRLKCLFKSLIYTYYRIPLNINVGFLSCKSKLLHYLYYKAVLQKL